MKNFLTIWFLTAAIIGCNNSGKPADISGTYILGVNNTEYERYDTVFLTKQGNGYRLNNHYQFRRFIKGEVVTNENQKIYSTVYYNESTKQYQQAETGSVLFFDQDKLQLIYNDMTYQKVK